MRKGCNINIIINDPNYCKRSSAFMHQIINYLLESDTNIKKSEADNQGLMAIKWQLKEQYRLLMFN